MGIRKSAFRAVTLVGIRVVIVYIYQTMNAPTPLEGRTREAVHDVRDGLRLLAQIIAGAIRAENAFPGPQADLSREASEAESDLACLHLCEECFIPEREPAVKGGE